MYDDYDDYNDDFDDDMEDDEEADYDEEYEEDENEDGFGDDIDPFGENEDPQDDEYENYESDNEDKEDKKTKNNKQKGKNGNKEDGKAQVKGGLVSRKPDEGAMNREAAKLKCPGRTRRRCPFCKQHSIYYEPMGPMMTRTTAQFIISTLTFNSINAWRNTRYVCLNPKCKAYYVKTATRFIDSPTWDGALMTSHWLDTPRNPFSLKF